MHLVRSDECTILDLDEQLTYTLDSEGDADINALDDVVLVEHWFNGVPRKILATHIHASRLWNYLASIVQYDAHDVKPPPNEDGVEFKVGDLVYYLKNDQRFAGRITGQTETRWSVMLERPAKGMSRYPVCESAELEPLGVPF